MGQKHSSSRQRHRMRSSQSRQEFTEVVDLEFSDVQDIAIDQKESNNRKNSAMKTEEFSNYPEELLKVNQHIQDVEGQLLKFSDAEIDLYFATLKDDLHNNWQKVYAVKNSSPQVKMKKTEIIEKIRSLLKVLNERFLKRQL